MKSSTWYASWRVGDEPVMLELGRLVECLRTIKDRRDARGRQYPLWLLLTVALLAKLAGINEVQALADWASHWKRELCQLLGFWRWRMPVATTWARVFARAVDVEELNRVLGRFWSSEVGSVPERGSLCVALDGKTLRGTIRHDSLGTHLLALYVPSTGVVLAQVEIGSKANEISAAPQLLTALDLRGMVVTGDAMFAQRELSLAILAAGGDYLWSVKDNQPHLKEAIETLFTPLPSAPGWGQPQTDFEVATSGPEKGHGRIETRRITVSSALQDYLDWPGLSQVFMLETTSTNQVSGQSTTTVRYGATSLPHEISDARSLLRQFREYWGIESSLHYCRDVVFGEDRCHTRMGEAAHLNATLNNTAITLLRRLGHDGIAASRRRTAYIIGCSLAEAGYT